MSWFKRGGERRSPESNDQSQANTDPNTCLEVFQNHWKQAWTVISCQDKRTTSSTGQATVDGVEAVLRNLEQMVTLLVSEDDDGGLPGPILNYVLESELLERFCAWCTINVSAHDRLRMQQLRLFELIISQAKQLLLVHKSVIKPLLRLLIDVANSLEITSAELEFKVVLVLHQICICISQQNLILESFFSSDTNHGPAKLLIFSLLIPYIHREGAVGQKARDALLLIMTLSARHPHIGHYIANNSDFCPVLATGLSGLYSSLPRRIAPPSDDWHSITWEDCVRIPDLQMFLNSLLFSNAVVQVAHPLVRNQLIEFIYSGFLVPVLAPALHQISREEVMTATAYLDLFVRHVTEPHLLKAALKFVLVEKYDNVPILDTLLSRINSSSELSTVTLALFHTLVDLNCEDVMFQLVFRYLVPCTHVMVSQRRSVRDLDLYGKSAEKFLSLRPSCCTRNLPPVPPPVSVPVLPPHIVPAHSNRSSTSSSITTPPTFPVHSLPSDVGIEQQHSETNYFEYLHDAHNKLEQTSKACQHWTFLYDGESPPPDGIARSGRASSISDNIRAPQSSVLDKRPVENPQTIGYIELGSLTMLDTEECGDNRDSTNLEKSELKKRAADVNSTVFITKCNNSGGAGGDHKPGFDWKLSSSLDNVDAFLNYLAGLEIKVDGESALVHQSLSESVADLEELVNAVFTGSMRKRVSDDKCDMSQAHMEGSMMSRATKDAAVSVVSQSENHVSNQSNTGSTLNSKTTTEVTDYDTAAQSRLTVNSNVAEDISISQAAAAAAQSKPTMQENKQQFLEASSLENAIAVPNKPIDNNEPVQTPPSRDNDPNSKVDAVNSLSPPTATLTKNKERIVPKDFPTSSRSNLLSTYTPAQVLSPLKSAGDLLSPMRTVLTPPEEFPVTNMPRLSHKKLNYPNDPPNIGPFLSTVFARLEGMVNNSLYFNLLLTDVLSRLASYPQPLLRSFLLNHNLVFQPSVKSLIQVLSSLRQKLDNYSVTVRQFDGLVDSARNNLMMREGLLYQSLDLAMSAGTQPLGVAAQPFLKPRADTIASTGQSLKEKKKVTLSDLIFRRSPGKDKMAGGRNNKKHAKSQLVFGDSARLSQYPNNETSLHLDSHVDSSTQAQPTTWNAVYCALILDEFLKELAAMSQEHSVLYADEGYLSS